MNDQGGKKIGTRFYSDYFFSKNFVIEYLGLKVFIVYTSAPELYAFLRWLLNT